jgi:hypothetical protein
MTEDDRNYFERRAEAEIALAQSAEHPGAVRSHYLLAGYYLDLVHSDEPAAQPVTAAAPATGNC